MTDPARIRAARPVEAAAPQPAPTVRPAASTPGASFQASLDQANGLRFSNHAQKRLETRAIQLGDDGLTRLARAVDRAAARGGRESLVLMDDLAFIVNVKDRLVVTAVDNANRGEGVFTQIDSVVLADREK